MEKNYSNLLKQLHVFKEELIKECIEYKKNSLETLSIEASEHYETLSYSKRVVIKQLNYILRNHFNEQN